jgi:hypothetical protein
VQVAYGFKWFGVVSLVVVILGATLVYGLKAGILTENQEEESLTAERVFDQWNIKLVIMVEKANYAFKEAVNVTLTLTNVGNETFTYSTYCAWRFDFYVFNSSDCNVSSLFYAWMAIRRLPTTGEMERTTLNAGESITATLQWPQELYVGYPRRPIQAPPGTYYIIGSTGPIPMINGEPQSFDQPQYPSLLMNELQLEQPIEITILSP